MGAVWDAAGHDDDAQTSVRLFEEEEEDLVFIHIKKKKKDIFLMDIVILNKILLMINNIEYGQSMIALFWVF